MLRFDYHLSCRLQDAGETVERQLRMPADLTVASLHQVLQIVLHWQNVSSHRFECEGETPPPDRKLKDLFEHAKVLTYHYHDWKVDIEVVRPYRVSGYYPQLLSADGAPPCDDRAPAADSDPEATHFDEAIAALTREFGPHQAADNLDPDDHPLLLKRYPHHSTLDEEPLDMVLVMDGKAEKLLAGRIGLRERGHDLAIEALEKTDYQDIATRLVVEDPELAEYLTEHTELPVETRWELMELDLPYYQLEHKTASINLSFAHLSDELLNEFLQVGFAFSLVGMWRTVADCDFFKIEGLTRLPLYVSVLGGAGHSYGLTVFDNPGRAAAALKGEPSQPLVVLSYLEGHESYALFNELIERGIGLHNYDVVPACLTMQPQTPARTYQLMVEVMVAILAHGGTPAHRVFDRRGGSGFEVIFPVDPSEDLGGPVRAAPKPGRNDPCWCGSGKKYKKCHLGKD